MDFPVWFSDICDFLYKGTFAYHMLVLCLIYMWKLEKREHPVLRFILGGIVCIAVVITAPSIHFLLDYGSFFLLFSLLTWFVCKVSPTDALYCATLAHISQHLVYSLFVVLFRIGNGFSHEHYYYLMCAAIYPFYYIVLARKLPRNGHFDIHIGLLLPSMLLIPLVILITNSLSMQFYVEEGEKLYYFGKINAVVCCVYALWNQLAHSQAIAAREELSMEKELWNRKREQYEMTRQSVDLINYKCHDLRKQITRLQRTLSDEEKNSLLNELKDALRNYDSCLNTGNEILDIVLTEKTLLCEQKSISMTCIADGKPLGMLNTIDLYTVFDNALDNAIEAASRIAEPEKRMISVNVRSYGGLVLICIENTYEGVVLFSQGDELPSTLKEDMDQHGFGLKSIRFVVQKYDGTMTVKNSDNIFSLLISFPLNEG